MASTPEQSGRIEELLDWAQDQLESAEVFFGHGTDNAHDEALLLLWHALELPLGQEFDGGARVEPAAVRRLAALLRRRIEDRVPAAYLTGTAWFCGLPFLVDQRVLIPRSPIAELIESRFSPWFIDREPDGILDLCCGSGCIGIACALTFESTVDLADVSPGALEIAARNCQLHGVQARTRCIESDLFDALAGRRYGLIVSNPPYVDQRDMQQLPPEYRHEPVLGLAGGGDGLELVDRILRQARDHLTPDGVLVVEVGRSAAALEAKYPRLPVTWLEFERGGEGVFVLEAADKSW